jgi:hypothetical protein
VPINACLICTTNFYVKPSHLLKGWGKYCSIECRTQAQFNGKDLTCHICNNKIYRSKNQLSHSKSNLFFCSKSCKAKWRNSFFREERHPNWLDGNNAYRDILLRTGKKQICNSCKLEDTRVLIVHHIDHNRKNNKQSNLIWVCMNCHYLIHHDVKFEDEFKKNILNQNGGYSSVG